VPAAIAEDLPARAGGFREAIGISGGEERKIHFFAMDLPHSDACFVAGYPAETTGGLLRLARLGPFAFLAGYRGRSYTTTRRSQWPGSWMMVSVAACSASYLFEDRFGRPGKGNDTDEIE
jgi:hypothetical protein